MRAAAKPLRGIGHGRANPRRFYVPAIVHGIVSGYKSIGLSPDRLLNCLHSASNVGAIRQVLQGAHRLTAPVVALRGYMALERKSTTRIPLEILHGEHHLESAGA